MGKKVRVETEENKVMVWMQLVRRGKVEENERKTSSESLRERFFKILECLLFLFLIERLSKYKSEREIPHWMVFEINGQSFLSRSHVDCKGFSSTQHKIKYIYALQMIQCI